MRSLLCVSLCFAVLLSGCASIICGSEKTVFISSDPRGAHFTITNPSGRIIIEDDAPTNVTLKRGRGWFKAGDYQITFGKEGCIRKTVQIEQGLEAGWYIAGNFVFGGFIGWLIVDPLTGAMYSIEDVHVTLECY